VVKRWPIIITQIIDQLYRSNHELSLQSQRGSSTKEIEKINAKILEAKGIIEKISKLKYQMGRNHKLEPIIVNNEANVDSYNSELVRLARTGKNTWFTAPWLFAECYLYRLIRSYFSQTTQWSQYDPFLAQKVEAFRESSESIYCVATMMHNLDCEKGTLESDPNQAGPLIKDMIQMCLWGNATDLSLLTHVMPCEIRHLQFVGKEAWEKKQRFILKNDQEYVWQHIKSMNSQRVDIVLDNAGYELYTDLVFADFLVTYTPYVSQVTFHPKLIPWFVSDVTPVDFTSTINLLLDASFFVPPPDTAALHHLQSMVLRWRKYVADGIFSLSVPHATPLGGMGESSRLADFWTAPWPYWNMQNHAEDLWRWFQGSGLVIFKGDLNYRKLTGDIQWPLSTPFHLALGPLAGSFPLLSLRTNKADVVVGIEKEVADHLDQSGEKWRVDGRYGLISFSSNIKL